MTDDPLHRALVERIAQLEATIKKLRSGLDDDEFGVVGGDYVRLTDGRTCQILDGQFFVVDVGGHAGNGFNVKLDQIDAFVDEDFNVDSVCTTCSGKGYVGEDPPPTTPITAASIANRKRDCPDCRGRCSR